MFFFCKGKKIGPSPYEWKVYHINVGAKEKPNYGKIRSSSAYDKRGAWTFAALGLTLSKFVAKGAPGADRENGSQSVPGVFSEGVGRLLLKALIRTCALPHLAYKNFGHAPFYYV